MTIKHLMMMNHSKHVLDVISSAMLKKLYKVYILSGENASVASQLYVGKYDRGVQSHRTYFTTLDCNLNQYGSFKTPRKSRMHTATNDDNAINVLAAIELQPTTSLRAIQRQSISPITSARRILKKYRYHPYKLRNVQTFHGGDAERRLVYVRRMIHERINLREILWTDESTFTNQGVNHQNTRYFRFISKMARWMLDFLLSLCSLTFFMIFGTILTFLEYTPSGSKCPPIESIHKKLWNIRFISFLLFFQLKS